MKTAIVTDSNSGVTQIEAQKMNVFVLPMPVIIEGQAYYEGIDLLPDQFFRALTERQAVSTSQPSPGDVTALWDKVLTEYDELVYIPMSSGLSASCATAQMLAEDYEGRVFVVDNHRISISQKSSAWDAVALREVGCGAQEIQRELEASGLDSIVYVGVETLLFLMKVAHLEQIMFWLFLAGNALYYLAGIALAFAFKDNRAFCKYLCPVAVFLKPMSYFSLLRVHCDESKCVHCGKCLRACPMDVEVNREDRKRKNGTECILCYGCTKVCPTKALH